MSETTPAPRACTRCGAPTTQGRTITAIEVPHSVDGAEQTATHDVSYLCPACFPIMARELVNTMPEQHRAQWEKHIGGGVG